MPHLLRILIAAGLTLLGVSANAQTYPGKPITIVVPFGPGSGTDTVTRVVAQPLGDRAQADRRGREQAGREWRHRGHAGRARRARRLHAADEHQQPAFGGAKPEQERSPTIR